ncbi:hypothetical protein [Halorarum salinum]|nr:hypothetical protein [Halobaculum salinum]
MSDEERSGRTEPRTAGASAVVAPILETITEHPTVTNSQNRP